MTVLSRWLDGDQVVVERDLKCPDCGGQMRLRKTEKYKWAKNGRGRLFYGCERYPQCKGTHGAHPNGSPLGIPADKPTKQARGLAHLAFDTLVEARNWSKRQGYAWLGEQLGIPKTEIKAKCHIAMFNIETCSRVVEICMKEGRR